MGRYGLVAQEPIQAETVFDWKAVLDGLERPTALICVGMGLAMQAARAASVAGLAIPEQLSLAVIPEPGAPQAAEAQFTAYEVPSDRIVDWATRLLLTASPGGVPRMVVVPGRLQTRRSTTRPATGSMSPLAAPGEAMV
jgi:DNA-binding LacI/PurR family transcriptional regulator